MPAQVDGPLSLRCYLQALETCYIRLCHKAELCTALDIANPRHPHAPNHVPEAQDGSQGEPTAPDANPKSNSNPGEQIKQHPWRGLPSTPDLMFQLSPEPAHTQSLPDASQPVVPSAAASEAVSLAASASAAGVGSVQQFGLNQIDYCCFHSPFHKLVRKAFARLCHIDKLRQQGSASHVAAQHDPPLDTPQASGEAAQEQQQPAREPQEAQAEHDVLQQQHPQQDALQQQHDTQETHSQPQLLHDSDTQGASASLPGSQKYPDQLHQRHQEHQQEAPDLQQHPQQQAQWLQQQQQAEAAELHKQLAQTLADRGLEKELAAESSALFEAKVGPGCLAGKELGNMYSGTKLLYLGSLVYYQASCEINAERCSVFVAFLISSFINAQSVYCCVVHCWSQRQSAMVLHRPVITEVITPVFA